MVVHIYMERDTHSNHSQNIYLHFPESIVDNGCVILSFLLLLSIGHRGIIKKPWGDQQWTKKKFRIKQTLRFDDKDIMKNSYWIKLIASDPTDHCRTFHSLTYLLTSVVQPSKPITVQCQATSIYSICVFKVHMSE